MEKDIIREFTENWKKEYIAYWNEMADKAYEIAIKHDEDYDKQYREIREILGKGYHQVTLFQGWNELREEIAKDAEREGERKYKQMVARVTMEGGRILDQANLRIGYDGSINGWVACEKGRVRVETIYAGGYNDKVIVNVKHGQRLHYRVLVYLF